METALKNKNWESGQNAVVLKRIHESEVNIAIFNRDVEALSDELDGLIKRDFELRSSGNFETVSNAIISAADLKDCPLIKKDITDLLDLFSGVTNASNYRLFFATVSSNMCKKFHTDINDLRMLCTYAGPGTLWLTEDNVNRDAEDCCDDDACLVIDESRVQQADTGAVIVLKGAIYPKEGTNPILHRSPTIEESGERRVLLRIDTDEFTNF